MASLRGSPYNTVRWQRLRARARARDGERCVRCGEVQGLSVDHRVAVADGGPMWDLDNLETLCSKCHRRKTVNDVRRRNGKRPKVFVVRTRLRRW